jgi:Helix-turn-helix.
MRGESMPVDASVFAKKLCEAREKSGFTLEQVAEAIGVTTEQVASWESGEQVPSALHLGLLTTLYAVEGDSLFDEGPLRYNDPLAIFAGYKYEDLNKLLPPKALLEIREWLNFVNDYGELVSGMGIEPLQTLLTIYNSKPASPDDYIESLKQYIDEAMENPAVLTYKGYLPPESNILNLMFYHPQVGYCSFVNVAGIQQTPPYLDRYPKYVLQIVKNAIEDGRLSVSAAANLLRVDSTTIERELLSQEGED